MTNSTPVNALVNFLIRDEPIEGIQSAIMAEIGDIIGKFNRE